MKPSAPKGETVCAYSLNMVHENSCLNLVFTGSGSCFGFNGLNTAQDPGIAKGPPCRGARYRAGQELCPRQKRAETPGNFGGERPVREGLTPVLAGERWNRMDEQGEVVDLNRGAKEVRDGPEPPKALRRPVPGQGASAPLAVPARP